MRITKFVRSIIVGTIMLIVIIIIPKKAVSTDEGIVIKGITGSPPGNNDVKSTLQVKNVSIPYTNILNGGFSLPTRLIKPNLNLYPIPSPPINCLYGVTMPVSTGDTAPQINVLYGITPPPSNDSPPPISVMYGIAPSGIPSGPSISPMYGISPSPSQMGSPFDINPNNTLPIPDPSATNIDVKKPNIYIYSDTDRDVKVELFPVAWITSSIPAYNKAFGWDVEVVNGSICGKNEFLFYEARLPDDGFQKNAGWIVEQKNLIHDMEKILDKYNFNDKEKEDFIEYWGNLLIGENDYIFYPQGNELINNCVYLRATPTPDEIFRLWFYIQPINESGSLEVEIIEEVTPIIRTGYTLVEWGGMLGK